MERETRGWKILRDDAGRATRMGRRIAPPIVPPTPVVVAAKAFSVPSPFTLCGAAETFSRLATVSKQRIHVILTSGERRFQPSPRGRRRDSTTIHPIENRRIRRFWITIGNTSGSDLNRVSDVTLIRNQWINWTLFWD